MEKEEQKSYVVIGLILLILLIATFAISQLGNKTVKPALKSPVSQTSALSEYNSFNLTLENEGAELRGVINNKTQVEVWSANGTVTELTYRGTIENYSGAQFAIWINKSIVDTVKVVQS